MICKTPFLHQGLVPVGCGQCMHCRIDRTRLWAHRMLLEQTQHAQSSFVTATYDDDHLPRTKTGLPTLCKKDYQEWFWRLRQHIAPLKFRYYIVGEYGDQTQRPHYHVAFFGLGLEAESIFQSTWDMGHVHVGDLTKASAQYIAGYLTKRMTKADDPRLKGRAPEFGQPSLKPGLGALAMDDLANAIQKSTHALDDIYARGDVPHAVQAGKKPMPLGRYLRGKLREKMGDPEEFKKESQAAYTLQMLEMRKEVPPGKTWKNYVSEMNEQKRLNKAARFKIYSARKKI